MRDKGRIAVRNGDIEGLRSFIAQGGNINRKNREGWTLLMEAVDQGQTEIVKLLLETGADVNARNKYFGCSALHYATRKPDICKLLLEHGADVNAVADDGWTALSTALDGGDTDTVCLMLEHIQEMTCLNTVTYEGYTALSMAEKNGYDDVVDILKRAGAKKYEEIVEDINAALIDMVVKGFSDTIKLLVAKGADVNARRPDGTTAIMEAAAACDTDIVSFLIENGADVNMRNNKNETALKLASVIGDPDTINVLKKAGAKE